MRPREALRGAVMPCAAVDAMKPREALRGAVMPCAAMKPRDVLCRHGAEGLWLKHQLYQKKRPQKPF